MKQRIFVGCTLVVLGLAATQTMASAQEKQDAGDTPGLEGVWFAVITPVDCKSRLQVPNAPVFRGLNMFSHDGSFTNEAAFPVPVPLRSSGLGHWQHTQGHTYTATFQFFRYNENGPGLESFLVMRQVALTVTLNGNQFTSFDQFQDFDANLNPITAVGSQGCNIEMARRLQ
jgi:hypothetical protein